MDRATKHYSYYSYYFLMAMSYGAIFLATCSAILLLRDVNLAKTRLRYILLMFPHISNSLH